MLCFDKARERFKEEMKERGWGKYRFKLDFLPCEYFYLNKKKVKYITDGVDTLYVTLESDLDASGMWITFIDALSYFIEEMGGEIEDEDEDEDEDEEGEYE